MTNEKRIIGRCIWCRKPISENQAWEEIYLDLHPLVKSNIHNGPIHKRCRVPYLKILLGNQAREIDSLEWMLEGYIKTNKKEKDGRKTNNK